MSKESQINFVLSNLFRRFLSDLSRLARRFLSKVEVAWRIVDLEILEAVQSAAIELSSGQG